MTNFEDTLNAAARGQRDQQGLNAGMEWLDPQRLTTPEWGYHNEARQVAGIVLGHRNGRSVGSRDERHVLTVVGAGGGAGASLILPNMLLYDGSMLIIDPDGSLARMTARARSEKGQVVVVLDPFGVSGVATNGFNPLDALDPQSATVADEAAVLADALIIGNTREPHWTNGARMLLKAVILATLTLPSEDRTLVMVRRLVSGDCRVLADIARRFELDPSDTATALVALLKQCDREFDGAVANIGLIFAAMTERERATIFATTRVQLEFLRSPALGPTLERGDFTLPDLRTAPTTLYLCLPVTRMATHARWLRMIIILALAAFERTRAATGIPVLMVLNDFAAIEAIEGLEVASAAMTECGVRLWFAVQSLAQLQARYPTGWQTLIANTGVMTFWANSDPATLDFLSGSAGMDGPALTRLLERKTRRCLVLPAGQAPVILERHNFAMDQVFAGRFDP